MFLNAAQTATVRTIITLALNTGYSFEQAVALPAMALGESSLNPNAIGDHGHSLGLFQIQSAGRDAIKSALGIDMASAGIEDQCRGMLWEIGPTGPEHNAGHHLHLAATVEQAVSTLIYYYERPADRVAAVIKRTVFAEFFYVTFADMKPVPAAAPTTVPPTTPKAVKSPDAYPRVYATTLGTFFTEVIQKDKRFGTTEVVNDVMLLEPGTRLAVQALQAAAAKSGHALKVLETYRSEARQQYLFTKHFTQLRKVGVHGYGLACDIALYKNGVYDPNGTDYGFFVQIADACGLLSGIDWGLPNIGHTFHDYDHVQRIPIFRQNALFAGTWYPPATYSPHADMLANHIKGA